ncbi:MAG: methyl-accepting chemotaxis protein [Caulobacter sp.]|nr:methyl-accepting chemotaxis protein [Caulobacter sp.]
MQSINQKVMAAGAAVLLMGAVSAGAGAWAVFHLGDGLNEALRTGDVLRNHMDADMMHDALRADVLMALRATDPASGVNVADVKKDIEEHAATFRADIEKNRALATDPQAKATLASLDAPLAAYIAGAESMVNAAAADPAHAADGMPEFMRQFTALEGEMGGATDKIEAAQKAAAGRAQANAKLAQGLMIAMFLLGIGFAIALVTIARRTLVKPLVDTTHALDRLAKGDLSVEPPHTKRADEIGKMSRALFAFKQAVADRQSELEAADQRAQIEEERRENEARRTTEEEAQAQMVASLAQGLSRLAAGDVTFRLRTAFARQYEQLRTDFNAAMEQLQETLVSVKATTHGILGGAAEISKAADDLSRRTEQQAASLEESAATLDEITATVKKSAGGADKAHQVAGTAAAEAARSGEVVAEATEAMGAIERSSAQITQIIGVIDEIAFQTNLLALNAGVEAARAGDAGRGFAVVASEVRALAQRSADAAKQIKSLIHTSSTEVGRGVELVAETGQALERIGAIVAEMNTLVAEIAASAREQSTALVEVNQALNQMDQVTQQNAAMVEETTAASHGLARETEGLAQLVERFQVADSHPARAAA